MCFKIVFEKTRRQKRSRLFSSNKSHCIYCLLSPFVPLQDRALQLVRKARADGEMADFARRQRKEAEKVKEAEHIARSAKTKFKKDVAREKSKRSAAKIRRARKKARRERREARRENGWQKRGRKRKGGRGRGAGSGHGARKKRRERREARREEGWPRTGFFN